MFGMVSKRYLFYTNYLANFAILIYEKYRFSILLTRLGLLGILTFQPLLLIFTWFGIFYIGHMAVLSTNIKITNSFLFKAFLSFY
ncbi:hypothetical protein MsAg5_00910 [Methanosarcinaceae archaeon Ag5]|uniref:Uncharacterized protein n=1 Tax=Methanolapillus africanus TaxID=3028297 RepID=A0AAE4MGN5_9EURY|nr:hypothetical protein [Methanosarcinaceae archaeon Ag5]